MEKKNKNIYDYVVVISQNVKFILITTFIVLILAITYSLLTPEYWKSTAVIKNYESSNTFSLPTGFLGIDSGMLGNISNSTNDFIGIMSSRTFSEDVIKKFNLINFFKINDQDSLKAMDLCLEKLSEIVKLGSNKDYGYISISLETKDKYLSADLANYYWRKLEVYNLNQRSSKGRTKRTFIESRVRSIKTSIDSLSNLLENFQKLNKTLDIQHQTKVLIDHYAFLVAKKTQLEIEYEVTKNYLSTITLEKFRKEIDQLNQSIINIENNSEFQYLLNFDDVPSLTKEYTKIKLDLEIDLKVYEFLYPQLEQAKIEEVKDIPSLEIIDEARVMGKRSKPKRALICLMSIIFSFIISSLYVIIRDDLIDTRNIDKLIEARKLIFGK
jgi:uncharacterized protein involved in exopolysaccharide biosynthesis